MKQILALATLIVMMLCLMTLASCNRVNQGEKCFWYDVSSGKAVNQTDNPVLPMGLTAKIGINWRFFRVQGTVMDYEFTPSGNGLSPYDETLEWDSNEGVAMSTSFKLYGHVSDPWMFFVHFGDPEYDYKVVKHKDIRVYEALRQAGRYIAQNLNELAETSKAEDIRTRPDWLRSQLLPPAQAYMRQFGFELTEMLFMGNFQYPDGNVISDARQQLTALDSEIRSASQQLRNTTNQVQISVAQAKIEANQKIAAARREASALLAESSSLANALKQSIDQIGIDATMRLKMAELFGQLTDSGAMPVVTVTEDSVFAAPFYPLTGNRPTTNGIPVRNVMLPESPVRNN